MDDFDQAIADLSTALAACAPQSLRARVLGMMLRFAEAGKRTMAPRAPKSVPADIIAEMLVVRDTARSEQMFLRSLLQEEESDSERVASIVNYYHARLAQIESVTMMSIAFVGTDREGSEEATWWATTAGELTIGFIVDMAPLLDELPAANSPNA